MNKFTIPLTTSQGGKLQGRIAQLVERLVCVPHRSEVNCLFSVSWYGCSAEEPGSTPGTSKSLSFCSLSFLLLL